jgi:hypothetical protein
MSWIKDIFTPKEGGTTIGNGLRGFISNVTGGAFGNGAMMRNVGETVSDYLQRIKSGFLTGLGSGLNSAQFNMNNPIKNGVIMDKIKNILPQIIKWGAIGLAALLAFKFAKNNIFSKRTNP